MGLRQSVHRNIKIQTGTCQHPRLIIVSQKPTPSSKPEYVSDVSIAKLQVSRTTGHLCPPAAEQKHKSGRARVFAVCEFLHSAHMCALIVATLEPWSKHRC